MTEEQLCELPIPKIMGRPLYPGGFPLKPEDVHYEGSSLRELYYVRAMNKPLNKEQEDFIKYYMLYYIHAPIWEMAGDPDYIQELRDTDFEKMNLTEVIMECLKYGLDPL